MEDLVAYREAQDSLEQEEDAGYGGRSQELIDLFEYLTSVADEKGYINYNQFLKGCDKCLGKNSPDDYLRKVFEMYADSEIGKENNVSKIEI